MCGRRQLNCERADSVRLERGLQFAVRHGGLALGQFLAIDFTRRSNGARKSDVQGRYGFAAHLDEADHDFIALLSFFHRAHEHVLTIRVHQGKALSQCARVAGALKSDQRSVQPLRLPIGIALLPMAGMRGEAVDKFMMAPVLGGLIGVIAPVAAAEAGRVNQGQAQRIVVRFI